MSKENTINPVEALDTLLSELARRVNRPEDRVLALIAQELDYDWKKAAQNLQPRTNPGLENELCHIIWEIIPYEYRQKVYEPLSKKIETMRQKETASPNPHPKAPVVFTISPKRQGL